MGLTNIEWCRTQQADGTLVQGYVFNPWWGCCKVSPGCDRCYAQSQAKYRYARQRVWGNPKTTPRRRFGERHWQEPYAWNRTAERTGVRRRVFCASMADVFEEHPQLELERQKLWPLIEQTPNLDWLLLTKRPQNIRRMLPPSWLERPRPNVWLGTSAETQVWADLRIPRLLEVPAIVHFVSAEPLLDNLDLSAYLGPERVNWVIAGGESGAGHRPLNAEWVRSLQVQCAAGGAGFFFKQVGGRTHASGGRLLDGREWLESPRTTPLAIALPADLPDIMRRAEFDAAEATIERGRQTFVEVGQALLAIQEGRGYRYVGYDTFEAYCGERWGWSRRQGYHYIAAATVDRNVQSIAHPPTLTHALALAPLPADEQRAIVQDLGDLQQYSTRRLRDEIKERRTQRVRDARAQILESAPRELHLASDRLWIGQADAGTLPTPFMDTDLFVTSPPYGIGLEGSDHAEATWSMYLTDARRWAAAMYSSARPEHGRLCLNIPLDRSRGSREPVYADWLQLLREAGWRYESTIVWKEGNVSNHQARGSVASPNAPHAVAPVEMILVMYRGQWNRGEPQRASDIRELDWVDWLSSTWTFAGEHRYRVGHMAPYPEELPRRLIQLFSFPGDLVSDPFVGSGTTAIAALKLGRRFCGSDVDAQCVALARARVAQVAAQDNHAYPASQLELQTAVAVDG
ncbi:MAG TPA: DUF5131 family protein [Chloroflexota bacterium]